MCMTCPPFPSFSALFPGTYRLSSPSSPSSPWVPPAFTCYSGSVQWDQSTSRRKPAVPLLFMSETNTRGEGKGKVNIVSMNDPVSQLRREQTTWTTANDKKASKTGTGKKHYEAFDSTGKPSPYTEIRCVLQPSQSPQARFFLAAVFSADFDDALTLLYSFMAVEVKGKNLREVR